MRELERTQRVFFDLVTAREELVNVLLGPEQGNDDLARLVRENATAGARDRIEVYRDMYFLRLRDSLAEDFPKVRAVVGDEGFDDLVSEFLEAHPPTPFLAELGARFPRFVSEHPRHRDRPWLAELASLEWARVAVFDAPDHEVLTLEELRGVAVDAFASLPIRLVPASIVVDLSWSVDEVWSSIEREEPLQAPRLDPRRVVVWRSSFDVLHETVSPPQARILDLARGSGVTFDALCYKTAEGRTPEAAARIVWETLGPMIAAGLVRSGAR